MLSGPFMHGLGSPLAAPYGSGVTGSLPGLGGFTLGQSTPGLRGLAAPGLSLATVLLVSNLNEEVSKSIGRRSNSDTFTTNTSPPVYFTSEQLNVLHI